MTSHTDFVNSTHDRLVAPKSLQISGDALVFYLESQGATSWGILQEHLALTDPPVHRAFSEAVLSWQPHHDTLSSFLLTMAYWHAVDDGLPNVGVGWANKSARDTIAQGWPELHSDAADEMVVFGGGGVVFCLFGDDSGGPLHVGTRTAMQLRGVEQMLHIEWDLLETADD